jgi:hypothetical protein
MYSLAPETKQKCINEKKQENKVADQLSTQPQQ